MLISPKKDGYIAQEIYHKGDKEIIVFVSENDKKDIIEEDFAEHMKKRREELKEGLKDFYTSMK